MGIFMINKPSKITHYLGIYKSNKVEYIREYKNGKDAHILVCSRFDGAWSHLYGSMGGDVVYYKHMNYDLKLVELNKILQILYDIDDSMLL